MFIAFYKPEDLYSMRPFESESSFLSVKPGLSGGGVVMGCYLLMGKAVDCEGS
jgi:hypothetical protein